MIFERLDRDGFFPSFDTDMQCETLAEVKEAIDLFVDAQDDKLFKECVIESEVEISPSLRWYNMLQIDENKN
jgi:hypothetical protein